MTTLKIVRQGAPIANHADVLIQHDDIALIVVDMKTKWCEVSALVTDSDGVESVSITTTPRTPVYSVHDTDTDISFPDFPGWHIAIAEVSRYTLKVCLTKEVTP